MDIGQDIQADLILIKCDEHGLRPSVIRRLGPDEPLRHIPDTAQRLEHRFGAPVATAAEPNTGSLEDQADSSRFGSFQLGRGKWQV